MKKLVNKKVKLTKKFLVREYIINKKSGIKIAKSTQYSTVWVYYCLRKYNIKIRDLRESHLGYKMPKTQKQKIGNSNKNNHKGKNNPGWKGGKYISRGYIFIYSLNHPYHNRNYVPEHRLVMEKWLRENDPNNPLLIEIKGVKYLRKGTMVHHKGIKYPIGTAKNIQDNRIENLKLFKNNSEHKKYHEELKKIHTCPKCGHTWEDLKEL